MARSASPSRFFPGAVLAVLAFLAGGEAVAQAPDAEATPLACPGDVGQGVACSTTRDADGAWVVMAMPAEWNRKLIVHAHGGPRTGEPDVQDSLDDLNRFAVWVRKGYAWTGSSYRRGGYGVRMAAEGVEHSRELFWRRFGRPDRTILHGQSWGGNVAAKTAELYALDGEGRANYDGVLLTNGVLTGGTKAYQFRADLRAVYQFYCRNHPSAEDGAYPVWQGLAAGSRMTRAELRRRVEACTGAGLSMRQRTADQSRRLRDILAVTSVAEDELVAHLSWATFLFQDLIGRVGGNPFDNSRTVYSGSSDDAALNAGVERFTADPMAVARLAYDADLSGLIVAPTISLHARHDPTVSYTADAVYAATVEQAGRSALLVQATTDEDQHSKLADGGYLTILDALEGWISTGARPDPAGFQGRCLSLVAARECKFTPTQ
ncbi:hypothetical protein ACIQC9_08475 [Brevundimonas sp. NPDC092305]|uniref:hypothetical protein n=1 Tax=Brevundimonas sp. NPDC092305 TaxID=3363957 RepID=UPI003813F996